MAIKLIALDCDGTLLDDNGKLLPSSVEAIKKAKNKGIRIVLVTGRPYISSKPILQKLGLDNMDDEYLAAFHGALLQTTSGQVISKTPLSFKDFADLDLFAVNRQVSMVVETPKYILTTMGNIHPKTAFESLKNKLLIRVRTLHQCMEQQDIFEMLKVLLIGDKDKLDKIEHNIPKWMKKRFTVARSEDYCIDVSPKSINKGIALKAIAEKLKVKPDEIMAFGNADNDIPMIEYAKYGVAMGNSSPKLIKASNIVTDDNNSDGIAIVLDKYI